MSPKTCSAVTGKAIRSKRRVRTAACRSTWSMLLRRRWPESRHAPITSKERRRTEPATRQLVRRRIAIVVGPNPCRDGCARIVQPIHPFGMGSRRGRLRAGVHLRRLARFTRVSRGPSFVHRRRGASRRPGRRLANSGHLTIAAAIGRRSRRFPPRPQILAVGRGRSPLVPRAHGGWERFGDISINKSTVGPQDAEAMILWTAFPDGEIVEPCADLLRPRDGLMPPIKHTRPPMWRGSILASCLTCTSRRWRSSTR
jgi:hypothetical protein